MCYSYTMNTRYYVGITTCPLESNNLLFNSCDQKLKFGSFPAVILLCTAQKCIKERIARAAEVFKLLCGNYYTYHGFATTNL